jgi:hypothetical protein
MDANAGQVLQDDKNFLVELIDWQGIQAVRKTAKPTAPKTRIDRLQNDVLGMRFFGELAKKHQIQLYVPKVYDSGEGFYVREFIGESCLLNEDADFEEAKGRLDNLVDLLAAIDKLKPGEDIGYTGSSNYKNLEQSISRWADENADDGLIEPEQATRAKEISHGWGGSLEPRIAHGDMSAYKHTFLRPDGVIALIDYENFSSQAARYFDAAWTYTRLYSFAATLEIPRYFLTSFIAKSMPAEHKPTQLMAVLTQRTLGMQKDADADLKSKGLDYRDRAKELLELVLQDKLELLT